MQAEPPPPLRVHILMNNNSRLNNNSYINIQNLSKVNHPKCRKWLGTEKMHTNTLEAHVTKFPYYFYKLRESVYSTILIIYS
jgi:hypothetical protein